MKVDTTPNDQAALAEIELARKHGEDPFGDDELDNAPVADEPAEEPDEQTPQAAADVEADEPPTATQPTYQAEVPADYQEQRKALMAEKAQAMKQLIEGELDVDAFAEIESRVSNSLEDLTAQRIRAETLREANLQNQQQQQQSEIRRLIARSKADVDYMADPKAQKQFDMALAMTQADPDNAALDFSDVVAQAHKAVLAMRGVATKGDKVAEAIKSRAPTEKPPVTLRGLPVAASAQSGGDALEALSRLTGQAYQAAFNKLPPAQKARLLEVD